MGIKSGLWDRPGHRSGESRCQAARCREASRFPAGPVNAAPANPTAGAPTETCSRSQPRALANRLDQTEQLSEPSVAASLWIELPQDPVPVRSIDLPRMRDLCRAGTEGSSLSERAADA